MEFNRLEKYYQEKNDIFYSEFVSQNNNSKLDISKIIIQKPLIPEGTEADNYLLQKMQGCLLGLAVGDAVGGPYEFEEKEIRKLHPVSKMSSGGSHNLAKGEWTDDTSMALCLSISLICKGKSHQYDQLMRYCWWKDNGYFSSRHQCFDIGNMTGFALNEFAKHKQQLFELIEINSKDSNDDIWITDDLLKKHNISLQCGIKYRHRKAGNGSLMRLAPVPMFFFGMKEKAIRAAEESSSTTHDDPEAVEACKFYTALIMGAFEGLGKDTILERGFYETYTSNILKEPKIIDIANGSYKVKDDNEISGSGYVVNSLKAALWALYNDNGSFQIGVFLAINLGDDTDTTAAIYGQLAGALYGVDSIPKEWRTSILYAQNIINIADWLFLCNKQLRLAENYH